MGRRSRSSFWIVEVLGLLAIMALGAYKFVEKTGITPSIKTIAVIWAVILVLFLAGWSLLHRRRPYD